MSFFFVMKKKQTNKKDECTICHPLHWHLAISIEKIYEEILINILLSFCMINIQYY